MRLDVTRFKNSHCPRLLNLADIPSRGLTGSELINNERWWIGTEFLCKPKAEWPTTADLDNVEGANTDLIKDVPTVSHSFTISNTQIKLQDIIDCKRFSSLHRLLVTTAYVFRFIKSLQKQDNHISSRLQSGSPYSTPTGEEITESEFYWIKSVQGDSFSTGFKHLAAYHHSEGSTCVKQFGLFLAGGILRFRGRLSNSTLPLNAKNPILLPHNHPFVTVLIQHYHERSKHSGANDTLMLLRENYWILKGKQAVKQVINKCVICLK